jgi:RHS repeat-associated protein
MIRLAKNATKAIYLTITFAIFCLSVPAANAETKNGASPLVLSLPSGPGSIEGLGEAFEPQLNSGTVSYSIPLETPPGRAGVQPSISLSYNGGNPNGILGLGWKLAVPMIQVRTEDGMPAYDTTDEYVGAEGEELVEVEAGVFRAEIEGAFNRYTRLTDGWQVQNKSGFTSFYGTGELSRIADGERIYAWCLKQQVDLNGNEVNFYHQALDNSNQRYLSEVRYNENGEVYQSVHFSYESRPDVLTDYRSGFPVRNAFRLDHIEMRSRGQLVRRYELRYDPDANVTLLSSLQEVGSDGLSTLPPVSMAYTSTDDTTPRLQTLDQAEGVILSTNPDYGLNDMNADGLPDLLVAEPGDHRVYQNQGLSADRQSQSWSDPMALPESPSYALGSNGVSLADIDADGKTDFVAQLANFDYLVFKNQGDFSWSDPDTFSDSTGLPLDFESPTVRLVDINNDKYIDVMLTEDGNGDFYDYYINDQGTGYRQVMTKEGLGDAMTFDQRPEMILSDMNGDRLQDIVLLGDDYLRYWPGMGNGEWDRRKLGNWRENEVGTGVRMFNPPSSFDSNLAILEFAYDQLKPLDVNGDGLTDFVFQPEFASYLFYWLNLDGLTWSEPFRVDNVPVATQLTTLLTADMNGNGTTDLLWNYSEEAEFDVSLTWQYLDFYPDEKPYLLKSVSNGIGKTTTFTYGSSVDEYLRDESDASTPTWSNRVPNPVNILKQLDINDGLNTYTTTFNYHEGYYDPEEKEFRGFAKAEQFELGDSSVPTLESAYGFHLGLTADALKGKPKEKVQRDEVGTFFTESYTWDVRTLAMQVNSGPKTVSIAYQIQKDRLFTEKGQGTPVTLRWQYEYDDYGNQTRLIEYGRLDDGWGDERTTESTFSASCQDGQDLWLLNLPITRTVRNGTSGPGAKASESLYFYDGNTTACAMSRGLTTEDRQWVEDSTYIQAERKAYDQYGNPTHLYDPLYTTNANGHYRVITYDLTFQTFPISEAIVVNSNLTLNMSANYDLGFGTVLTSTDFNGYHTSYGYDGFGRLTSITKPLDSQTTVEYDYVLAYALGNGQTINWVETRQRESSGGGTVDSRQFYDGLSRLVMTRSEGETGGQIVVSDTVQFNARKTEARKYLPYFETGTLAYTPPTYNTDFTEHTYDALGREIRMEQPDGSFAENTYAPLIKTIRDEEQTNTGSVHNGAAMRYEEDGLLNKDGQGRLRRVAELMPEAWVTQYRYDVLDNLTGYTDSQGNQKHIEYDGLSRKTFMNDPDRGHMNYTYDDASNIIQTLDAKGQIVAYTYDGVNRLLTEIYKSSDTPAVRYHYDAPQGAISPGSYYGANVPQSYISDLLAGRAPQDGDANNDGKFDVADIVKLSKTQTATLTASNTLGQLAWIDDEAGEEHYSYDERARKIWTIRSIDDGANRDSYYTGMAYDSMDRVTRLTYPDRSYVEYSFNNRGLLEIVPNVIEGYDYNPAGQNKTLNLANGTQTQYDYDRRLRLSRLTTTVNSLTLQSLNYSYDAVSNITQITDGRNSTKLNTLGSQLGIDNAQAQAYDATQTFSYDNLYRLTQARNDQTYGQINYAYDQIGNMVQKNASLTTPDELMDLGTMRYGGNADASNRNGRAANDEPGPHALTSTSRGPDGELVFDYDANGNMTQDRDFIYSWDEKDRLVQMSSLSNQGTYTYDFNNIRKLKHVTDSQGQTVSRVHYIDKYSEVRDGRLIKYVYAGSSRVARTTQTTTDKQALTPETFFHHDHLGSSNQATNTAGAVTEHLSNYPFGRNRLQTNLNDTNKSDYRFTGKETDNTTQLKYFEARYLASISAGFVSVDPIALFLNETDLKSPQLLNSYAYALNRPYLLTDNDGRKPALALIGGLIGGNNEMARQNKDSEFRNRDKVIIGVLLGAASSLGPPSPSISMSDINSLRQEKLDKVEGSLTQVKSATDELRNPKRNLNPSESDSWNEVRDANMEILRNELGSEMDQKGVFFGAGSNFDSDLANQSSRVQKELNTMKSGDYFIDR